MKIRVQLNDIPENFAKWWGDQIEAHYSVPEFQGQKVFYVNYMQEGEIKLATVQLRGCYHAEKYSDPGSPSYFCMVTPNTPSDRTKMLAAMKPWWVEEAEQNAKQNNDPGNLPRDENPSAGPDVGQGEEERDRVRVEQWEGPQGESRQERPVQGRERSVDSDDLVSLADIIRRGKELGQSMRTDLDIQRMESIENCLSAIQTDLTYISPRAEINHVRRIMEDHLRVVSCLWSVYRDHVRAYHRRSQKRIDEVGG